MFEQRHPGFARHVNVEQDQAVNVRRQLLARVGRIFCSVTAVAPAAQKTFTRYAESIVVVNHEELRHWIPGPPALCSTSRA